MTRRKEPEKPVPGGGPNFHPGLREQKESEKKHGDKYAQPSSRQEMDAPYLGPDGDSSPDDMDVYLDEGNIADASAVDKKNKDGNDA